MRRAEIPTALITLFASFACAATPPPGPDGPDSAGLCVIVRTRSPIPLSKPKVDRVFFVRLPGGPGSDPVYGTLYSSNYENDGYVYLLNAPPGHYVAVAASRTQDRPPASQPAEPGFSFSITAGATDYTTYFSRELIRATTTEAVPGTITFLGDYTVDQSVGLDDADDTQLHFFGVLAPGAQDRGALGDLFAGDYHYRGDLIEAATGEDEGARFRAKARAHLADSEWVAMLPGS